jgi:glutamyl-tRNA synthetase
MPLLRNPDKQRSKISKRKNPAARLTWFVEQGYLPEALRNFLALVGYSMPDLRERFSFEEMVESFDWHRVSESGGVFDLDKLGWLNGEYIRSLDTADLTRRIVEYLMQVGVLGVRPTDQQVARIAAATPLVQTRMQTLAESVGMLSFLLIDEDRFEVSPEGSASLSADAPAVLAAAVPALESLGEWNAAAIESALRAAIVEGLGVKPKFAFGPLRVAVTGRRISPPLFESMDILGRDVSVARLRSLRDRLQAR